MADQDQTHNVNFQAPPSWWMPILNGAQSSASATARGHTFLLVSEDIEEAILFGAFLAARQLCHRSDGYQPCGDCNSCRSLLHDAHGDFLRIRQQEGKTMIGIEQIRDATRFAQQTALYGENKVLLFEAAERMTLAAANSVLKTIEEPAGKTLVLLASSEVWRLPATVRSRCQRLMVPRPTQAEGLSWLSAQLGCDATSALERLIFARGQPIAAWIASDSFDFSLETTLNRSFENISSQQTLPSVWANIPIETLLERLLVWVESQARGELLHDRAAERASWLTLHRCIAELSGRVKLGATPSQDIFLAEVYRLCRSRRHSAFDDVAGRFLSNLGRLGRAG